MAGLCAAFQRFKTRAHFQAALAAPVLARTPHFALHRLSQEAVVAIPFHSAPACVWVGAMVPKRWAKRAVTRNGIRRQIYSLMASSPAPLPAGLAAGAYLVRLRTGFGREQFPSAWSEALSQAVRGELHQLLARIAPPAP